MDVKMLIFLFLLVTCNLTGVFGIDCYQYSSFEALTRNVGGITCGEDYVCTRVSYVVSKILVTLRSCDLEDNACNNIETTLRQKYADLSNFKCYTCSTQYCNGEGNSGATLIFSLAIILCGLIFNKIF